MSTSEDLEDGLLDISPIAMTADTSKTVISQRGVYLFIFTSVDNVRSGMYIVVVHGSSTGHYAAVLEPSGMTVTFNSISNGACNITTSMACRLRVIRIADANY